MTLHPHLNELRRKHETIDARIEQEQRSPGSRDTDIVSMKKEKLRLKEEISRLSGELH